MKLYLAVITECLIKLKRTDIDPVHVLALMRTEYGTLDHLSRAHFASETKKALQVIDNNKPMVENLAKSYGMRWREQVAATKIQQKS